MPRAIEALAARSEVMPSRCAVATTAPGATLKASLAATELIDRARALVSVTGPQVFVPVVVRLPIAESNRLVDLDANPG